jgi:hypothetical protein
VASNNSPLIGAPLDGRWEEFRFVLGPWRWLLLVYVFIEPEDRVVVVTIQDGLLPQPRPPPDASQRDRRHVGADLTLDNVRYVKPSGGIGCGAAAAPAGRLQRMVARHAGMCRSAMDR